MNEQPVLQVKEGIIGTKGPGRLTMLRIHRLVEFERAFSDYLEGKTTANRVAERARKMLEVGLPRLK